MVGRLDLEKLSYVIFSHCQVKSSAPTTYHIEPTEGLIQPGGMAKITVEAQGRRINAISTSFILVSVIALEEGAEGDPDKMKVLWTSRPADPEDYIQHRSARLSQKWDHFFIPKFRPWGRF